MDETTNTSLHKGGGAAITTTGRKSGQPRRTEIYFHQFDGEFFIGGRPGFKRDWLANLLANPRFTLHLSGGTDVAAEAQPVYDSEERRRLFLRMMTENWGSEPDRAAAVVDKFVETSPLVSFTVVDR